MPITKVERTVSIDIPSDKQVTSLVRRRLVPSYSAFVTRAVNEKLERMYALSHETIGEVRKLRKRKETVDSAVQRLIATHKAYESIRKERKHAKRKKDNPKKP